jgi:hypothetical protein
LLSIFLNLDILMSIIFFFEFLFFAELSMCQASGIQCLNPAFGEKDANMKGNAMISMVLLQPLLFLPTILGIFIDIGSIKLTLMLMRGIIFLYIIITSFPLLYIGLKKLKKME